MRLVVSFQAALWRHGEDRRLYASRVQDGSERSSRSRAWLMLPSAVHAQGSITGVVRDTSGAVLPGVTVEASSPALIEKTRSVVTDGTGQDRLVDLRPGTYTVTFSLAGFAVVKREAIELTAAFTATVNAELRVGALEETLTVTGEPPIVDIQSTTRATSLGRDVIDPIPTGRSVQQYAVLLTGVTVSSSLTLNSVGGQDVGGATGTAYARMSIHGSRRCRSESVHQRPLDHAVGHVPGHAIRPQHGEHPGNDD